MVQRYVVLPQRGVALVSTDVHGSSMMPALILPLPFIARTDTAACKELAGELRKFIVQEDLS